MSNAPSVGVEIHPLYVAETTVPAILRHLNLGSSALLMSTDTRARIREQKQVYWGGSAVDKRLIPTKVIYAHDIMQVTKLDNTSFLLTKLGYSGPLCVGKEAKILEVINFYRYFPFTVEGDIVPEEEEKPVRLKTNFDRWSQEVRRMRRTRNLTPNT